MQTSARPGSAASELPFARAAAGITLTRSRRVTGSYEVGQGSTKYLVSYQFLDPLQFVHVIPRHKCDCHPGCVSTGGTAHAVHIILCIRGGIKVDNKVDILNVNAPAEDISGYQYTGTA